MFGVGQDALDHVQVADLEGCLVVYYGGDLLYELAALDLSAVVYQHCLDLAFGLCYGLETGLDVLVDFDL